LRGRRLEIEQAILARVYAVSDPTEAGDPAYVAGLRPAVSAAFDYGLSGLERDLAGAASIPAALVEQVRHAARTGVNLDTVLRRYFAGYTLLGDFVLQEVGASGGLGADGVHLLGRRQAVLFDGLVAAVSNEYRRETLRLAAPDGQSKAEQRRAEAVRKLLAGDLVDTAAIEYGLEAWHTGAVVAGPGGVAAVRTLAATLERSLLLVQRDDESVWAWFGGMRPVAAEDVVRVSGSLSLDVVLAIGEPGRGLAGWRLTHRQALAALPIALQEVGGATRYADVALLAAALRDEMLASTLRALYLEPLTRGRDDGAALRQTLLFGAGRHVSSSAAALGVSRQTVNSRLRTIERLLGRALDGCAAELETALRLDCLSS
jgi:hypothetical protein